MSCWPKSGPVSDFVLDSSVAIAWFFPESENERLYAASVSRLIRDGESVPVVPALFHVELGSFLSRRRRTPGARFGAASMARVLDDLDALGIRTRVWPYTYRDIVQWAERYHVQAKDAPFIHLAHAQGLPLATLDGGQRQAAKQLGFELLRFN